MHTRFLYTSSPDWAVCDQHLDKLLESADFRVIKKTSRTLAGALRINGTEVFVKRVDLASWNQGLAKRFFGSHAKRALRGSALLDGARVAHPKPLAALESRRFGAVRSSYVITEMLRRPRTLSRFALSDGRNFNRRHWLSMHLAREIRRVHDAGCFTRDLQETNLMLETRGTELTVYFLDLEDFRRLRWVPLRLRMLNLIHLDRSIGRFVSRTQRLRFLYNYLGGKPGHDEARQMLRRFNQLRARIERKRRGRHSSVIVAGFETEPPAEGTSSAQ